MEINRLFELFKTKRILVVGDVMLDAYLSGRVSRISPEAPVPIVQLNEKEERLGGAANVALNLLSLGATPILCACIGNDESGARFIDLMKDKAMNTDGILVSDQAKTTVKTRVIANKQHLLRIDDEHIRTLNPKEEQGVLDNVEHFLQQGIDAIIIEDYNKGLLSENLISGIIQRANRYQVITAVDPKKDNFFAYKNVTLFKPNLKELKDGLKLDFNFSTERTKFEEAIASLEEIIHNQISFVTLSEHGVFVKQGEKQTYIGAHVRTIADVSGAGDTVIAVATLCLTAGLNPEQMARVANLSGGLVCEMSGVVPIDKELLTQELAKLAVL